MQWDHVSPEFAELSLGADRQPVGPARVRAHEECLRLAQRHGSFAEEYVARTDLTAALYYVADSPDMLTHVAWLRAALAPEHGLAQAERDDVLWKLKWAVDKIEKMPEVPLTAWRAAIDDMDTAYRADGYHLRPGHAARAWLASATGDPEERDRQLALWRETPRDGRSDCEACETRGQALLTAQRDVRAGLELLTPVVAGGLTCAHEPAVSLAHDAELRTTIGDLDGAAESFRRSWHLLADDIALAPSVARCLRVLVRIGNTDRAVDLFLDRLPWLDELRTGDDRMWFCATGAWVLHHGRRLGLAPDEVDGRPTVEVQDELAATARDLGERFDARNGSDVVSRRLAAACDDTLVATEPTLPPTHLPATDADPGRSAPTPTTGAEVVALAARVEEGRRTLEGGIETALRGWAASRETVLPVLDAPEQWAAAASLDRASAHLLRNAGKEQVRLREARDLADRAGDDTQLALVDADLAVLDVRLAMSDSGADSPAVDTARGRALERCRALEEAGIPGAAGVLRWYALSTRAPDALEHLTHAADLYDREGWTARRALCLVEAAPFAHDDPDRLRTMLEEAEWIGGDNATVRSAALDLRARLARAEGDLDAAVTLYEQSLAAAGPTDGTRMAALFALCDVLVDRGDWQRLEAHAADTLALAARVRDPLALAVAQRHLGLAWVETGRPAEAAELLEAALPVIQEHVPDLVGPTAWALGNACAGLGSWAAARRAFATASVGFEGAGRVEEASHAQYRAGMTAWDAEDLAAAAAHLEDAVDKARASGSVQVLFAGLRSRAALRASTEDLDAGIADLDRVLDEVERFAAGLPEGRPHSGPDGEEFDAEEHEPDVLRQAGHLYARGGRPDDAVERLTRAEALVGGDFAVVLRSEIGVVLADADRLEEAEPRLRASLGELRSAGLHDERVTAAQALARALDRAGRPDDAEAVWAAFGPEA